jgi:hypothetical protein
MLTSIVGVVTATAMLIAAVSPLIVKGLDLLTGHAESERDRLRLRAGVRAVEYAEEWARALVKLNPQARVDGESKLQEALDFYLERLPKEDRAHAAKFLRSLLSDYDLGAGAGHETP